jgi:uncharacterized membrane protein HdeD (DUF308 family)
MADLKYCKNCEEANPPDAKFCAWCGAAFVSAAAPPPDTAPLESQPAWQPPSTSPAVSEQKTSMGLRILEIIAGIIVLALGAYDVAYPGVTAATLFAFLAVGFLIIGVMEFVRVFQAVISGWWRLVNLILSIIIIILAIAVLAYPFIYGWLTLLYLLSLALIFAGFASIARGTSGAMIIGVIGIILASLAFVEIILYPPMGFELSSGVVLVLLFCALGLIIFGLEAIVSGVVGRWV